MDVITKTEENVDGLNEDLNKTVQNRARAVGMEEYASEINPIEEMSYFITQHLAEKMAGIFAEMVDGKGMDIISQIIRKLETADSKTAVEMLKTMLLVNGKDDEAKDLDIISICEAYNIDAFDDFMCELLGSDEFDWFLVEFNLMEAFESSYSHGCRF